MRLPRARWWFVLTLSAVVGYLALPQLLLLVAEPMIATRDHENARWTLNLASMLKPASPSIQYQLARVNRRLELESEFQRCLQKARDNGLDESLAKREEVIQGLSKGQYPADIAQWRNLIENAGSDLPEICEAFVLFRMRRFETPAALEILDAWQAEYPNDAKVYHVRGKVLHALLRTKLATEQFRKAAALDDSQAEVFADLGRALMDQLLYDESVTALEKCLALEPDNWDAVAWLAEAYQHTNRLDEARSLLQDAIGRSPGDAELLFSLGSLELETGDPQAALGRFQAALKLRPTERKLRYELARTLQALGRDTEAAQEFAFVREATEAVMRLPKLTAELVDDPQNLALRFEVAEISWKYESPETGARWLHEVLTQEPNHLPALRMLSEHYRLMGDDEKAELLEQRAERVQNASR